MSHRTSVQAVTLAALVAACPAAAAQDDHAPTLDVVSIQDRPGFVEAVVQIAEGKEREGLDALARILVAHGDDPDVYLLHYNVACGQARVKELVPAWASLHRAIELGYGLQPGQIENLERDPDLEALRADPRFGELVKGAVERLDETMKQYEALTAPFTWVPPPPLPAEGAAPAAPPPPDPRPLLILLHPFASEREAFARRFLPFAEKHRFALLAPQGKELLAPGRFAWFSSDGDFISRFRLETRRVYFALESLRKEAPIDPQRIYAVGFGQGASLGFALALRNPQWVRGAVLVGGGYAPAALDDWVERAAASGRRVALVHGQGDPLFPFVPLPPFADSLRAQGLALQVVPLEGGHVLPEGAALETLLLEQLSWIDAAPWKAPEKKDAAPGPKRG